MALALGSIAAVSACSTTYQYPSTPHSVPNTKKTGGEGDVNPHKIGGSDDGVAICPITGQRADGLNSN